jgi:nickel/cobalt exporter
MTTPLSLFYFPLAIGLGALHALEPGHSKTLIAAYLIGTHGTRRHALMLGLSAAATHSIVVIGLSVIALWLGSRFFTDAAMQWLQLGSGLIVITLGCWMVWRRLWMTGRHAHHHHQQADPIEVHGALAEGSLSIIDSPVGERLRLALSAPRPGLQATVDIIRQDGVIERLRLIPQTPDASVYLSDQTPAEPHEFTALLQVSLADRSEQISFAMQEPEGHHHESHAHLDDVAHARAHAADLPAYVQRGEQPSLAQVIAFGAAGGLIPCPASVTVMLLALSVGKTVLGLIAVLCFSIGLAITMVGIGLLVVAGVERLSGSAQFAWLSVRAPLLSALVIILSGIASVMLSTRTHLHG